MKVPPLTPEQMTRAKAAFARRQAWISTYVLIGRTEPRHLCDVADGMIRQSAILANGYILRMLRSGDPQ